MHDTGHRLTSRTLCGKFSYCKTSEYLLQLKKSQITVLDMLFQAICEGRQNKLHVHRTPMVL